MPKTIVTHFHPDLDAIMSAWLLVRFDQSQFGDAQFAFCSAGQTYRGEEVDSDPDTVHVDTGMGRYDHHMPGGEKTCAARLVFQSLQAAGYIDEDDSALRAMSDFAYEIDTFADCYWPEAEHPRYAFMLHEIIPALHALQIHDNEAVLRAGFLYLDGVYQFLKNTRHAKEAIQEADREGQTFDSPWGRGIYVTSSAGDVSKVAQKMGYGIVIIYDPIKKYMKIKTAPKVKFSLRSLYDKIVELEPLDMWIYHPSGHIVLNGSDKGPKKLTELSIEDILGLIGKIEQKS